MMNLLDFSEKIKQKYPSKYMGYKRRDLNQYHGEGTGTQENGSLSQLYFYCSRVRDLGSDLLLYRSSILACLVPF